MAKNIAVKDPKDLDIAFEKIFADYVGVVSDDVKAAAKKAASDCVKELKQTSPKKTGAYAKGWQAKKEAENASGVTYRVRNKTRYYLTHLLEYGHPIVRGGKVVGRAKAIAHIRPAEQKAENEFIELIKKGVKNDSR